MKKLQLPRGRHALTLATLALFCLGHVACSGGSSDSGDDEDMGDDAGGASAGGSPADGTGGFGDGASNAGGGEAGESGGSPGAGGSQNTGAGGAAAAGGSLGAGGEPVLGDPDYILGEIQLGREMFLEGMPIGPNIAVDVRFASVTPDPSLNCDYDTSGDCTLAVCTGESSAGSTAPRLTAGTITFTGEGSFLLVVETLPEEPFFTRSRDRDVFGEEILTFSSSGGTVEAFSGTAQIPLAPLLLTPVASSPEPLTLVPVPVSSVADFTMTWDARASSQFLVITDEQGTGVEGQSVRCQFDASLGEGTIPAEIIQALAPGTVLLARGVNQEEVPLEQGKVVIRTTFGMVGEDRYSFVQFVVE